MTGPAISVNALRLKHPRGAASLPEVPVTPPGRILGVALLADTFPGTIGHDAPEARVTASLAVRWALAPDAAAPARATLRRLAGHAPYVAVDGRIRTADGRLVASTLALFAAIPRPRDVPAEEHAGELSADGVGIELDEAVRRGRDGRADVVLRPEWRNRLGILHGAVGSSLLAIAASHAVAAAWPRIADAHVRFLHPVTAERLVVEARVLRRSERSADVEVQALAGGEPALLGRYLLLVPAGGRVR